MYYAIFRRFFEENYSIYHVLEPLTIILLIIPTQAIAISNVYSNISFSTAILVLIGNDDGNIPLLYNILGAVYVAIVISIIISNLPIESIKSTRVNHLVIGNGDVVKYRLLPALTDLGEKEIIVFKKNADELELPDYHANILSSYKDLKQHINENSVIWISTPSNAHVKYLTNCIQSIAKLIVVEKPITDNIKDLDLVCDIINDSKKRNKLFFLSYYLLEKALPLIYFKRRNNIYRKYLYFDNEAEILKWSEKQEKLLEISVVIIEGEDKRSWTFEKNGQIIETFIHNVLIATEFCGLPDTWGNCNINSNTPKSFDKPLEIAINSIKQGTKIHLILKKNEMRENCKRYAKLIYQTVEIYADFDSEEVSIKTKDGLCIGNISVKNEFKQKYSIQTDLVKRCYLDEIKPNEADGLFSQCDVLRWLINQRNKISKVNKNKKQL